MVVIRPKLDRERAKWIGLVCDLFNRGRDNRRFANEPAEFHEGRDLDGVYRDQDFKTLGEKTVRAVDVKRWC